MHRRHADGEGGLTMRDLSRHQRQSGDGRKAVEAAKLADAVAPTILVLRVGQAAGDAAVDGDEAGSADGERQGAG